MSGDPGRQDTVKHIDASFHCFKNIVYCTDTHFISWLIFRKIRDRIVQHLVMGFLAFTDRSAADRIAIKIHFHELFRAVLSQIRELASLHYTKQSLVFSGVGSLSSLCPAKSPVNGILHIFVGAWIWDTLIKGDGDIRSDSFLDVDRIFRGHEQL